MYVGNYLNRNIMQVNITIPDVWKEKLDRLARKKAFEEDRDVTYLDIIRDAIRTHCEIVDQNLINEASSDCANFIKKYVKIMHPSLGLINFDLHPFQERLVDFVDTQRFGITRKFRQGGFTTTSLAWALWKCIYTPNYRVLYVAKTDRECVSASGIVDIMLRNLPTEISPIILKQNSHEISFGNKSVMWFHTTEPARGKVVNQLFIDDAAFIKDCEKAWIALWPTIAENGKCFVLSTPNGVGNWFQETYFDAEDSKNRFSIFEANYTEHPVYQNETWVKQIKESLGPKGFAQEVEAAFIIE